MSKLSFALNCLGKIVGRQDTGCPYCGNDDTQLVERKHVILQLRRCARCSLLFRWPKEALSAARRYYQTEFRQGEAGNLPTADQLARLLGSNLSDTTIDHASHVALCKRITPAGRILDYGASWGYSVYQFRKAGYDATGYEISEPRLQFGRDTLRVPMVSDVAELVPRSFDLIHTAHVLEHIPQPKLAFEHFDRLLKPDGVLVIYVPNAGGKLARENGVRWTPMIDQSHVLALTAPFLDYALREHGFTAVFGSAPYAEPERPLNENPNLDGNDLLAICRRSLVPCPA